MIGSGIAGLIYALEVADYGSVTVLCKSDPTEGSTQYAQGGIASVISPLDSFEAHIKDTLDAGAGLCDPEVVKLCIQEGPNEIKRLIDLGARFDKQDQSDQYSLGQEGGHSARRILHAGDATGAEIQRAVYEGAAQHPNIRVVPHQIAIDLVVDSRENQNEVVGCYALDKSNGEIHTFAARSTMLAAGGVGKVYVYTSNPDVATGDGIAMAYRAGAAIANMEFIQFHPTCLYHSLAKSFLITEAMRGEGAILRLPSGEEFMEQYDARKELAPRDIVARAIDDQMKKRGVDCVLLDISHRDPEFIRKRFPTITERLRTFGFDPTTGPFPVVPAAHYCCGGVVSDKSGRTNLPRLYTAGECASTGLHGANRLASNSLLEASVFAARAGRDTVARLDELSMPKQVRDWDYVGAVESSEEVLISHSWDEVRRLMWNLVGIVRSEKRLKLAKRRIEHIKEEIRDYYWRFLVTSDLIELRNITMVAELIIRSALSRKESRGLHFTLDYPNTLPPEQASNTVLIHDFKNNKASSAFEEVK